MARPNISFIDPGSGDGEDTVAHLERAAIQRLHAGQATIERSLVGIARADRSTVRQSVAGAVIGRSVAADQVRTAILAAPVIRGEVHTWFDLRTAVAIGLGMAFGHAFLGAVRGGVRRLLR